jgi:pyruvate carboxylase
MYPKVFDEFEKKRAEFGPVDKLPTRVFLVGLDNGESCEVCFIRISILASKSMGRGYEAKVNRQESSCLRQMEKKYRLNWKLAKR